VNVAKRFAEISKSYDRGNPKHALLVCNQAIAFIDQTAPSVPELEATLTFDRILAHARKAIIYERFNVDREKYSQEVSTIVKEIHEAINKGTFPMKPSAGASDKELVSIVLQYVTALDADTFERWRIQMERSKDGGP
jgi:hypothetical protein